MIEIRNGQTSDLEELYFLLNNGKENRDFDEGEEYPKKWIKNLILHKKENMVIIAYEDKELVGFLIAHLLKGIRDSILNNIYVKPKYRKKGIASLLLKNYESNAKKRGMKFSAAMSQTENKKIRNFNEKHNYKRGHKFYFYYKWF